MDRQKKVQHIGIFDFALALLSIFYETMAVTFGERKYFTEPDQQNDTSPDTNDIQPNFPSDASTKLLAFVIMVCVIFGIFLTQTFMAAKLFMASKKMRNKPLAALQKFSCWRIWSCVFLFLLIFILITSVIVNLGSLRWTHGLLYSLLSVHIAFRVFGIYYVGLCRKDVKDGLVHPAFSIDSRQQPPPPPPLHLQPQDLRL